MNKQGDTKREKWSSWVAFVWAATGAAVGLGNVWKFPYMAGSNGGSAFVLIYLVFVFLVAVPVMAAEIMLGKLSERNAVDGFLFLAEKHGLSKAWCFTGYLGSLTLQLVFCFYSVVAGFSIAYIYFGATNSFYLKSPAQVQQLWERFLLEPWLLVICSFLFVFFTMMIVYFGVKKGIERVCTLMMPGLFAVLIVLVFYSASSGGLAQALTFLFSFEPEKINANVVISSLGHAFFTLAVGACAMMVYGSYLPKKISVAKSVLLIAFLDVSVALLSGLAIFPLIFEAQISPSQGPGLMFVSLPIVFSHMPMGWFFCVLFFILLFFAALSSALSFAEPLVDLLMEKLKFSRKNAVFIISAITCFGSVFCALSFNLLDDIKIFDRFTIFDVIADTSTNVLLPIGGIAISVFAGLVVKRQDFFTSHQKYGSLMFSLWRVLTLIVAPFAILIVLINGIMSTFI